MSDRKHEATFGPGYSPFVHEVGDIVVYAPTGEAVRVENRMHNVAQPARPIYFVRFSNGEAEWTDRVRGPEQSDLAPTYPSSRIIGVMLAIVTPAALLAFILFHSVAR